MNSTEVKKKADIRLIALDPYAVANIVEPIERPVPGKDMVEWGVRNAYPDYLLELYDNVPTLSTVIDGTADFIAGDGVSLLKRIGTLGQDEVNRSGETVQEQVRQLAADLETYGGFALQVIRSRDGAVAELYWLDMRFLRMNKECNVFYYCEKWNRPGVRKVLRYPAFMKLDWARLTDSEREEHLSSVLFVKRRNRRTYPTPPYASAIKACEIERAISDFHLNSVHNSFTGSMMVNFNNGIPDDKIKEQIEDEFMDKFSGPQNGGSIVFCWNNGKENAATMTSPKVEDFGERYHALADWSRQEIFTAFRANPNLFGIPTEGNGFSNEEYEESFRLYNRTAVRPAQQLIRDAYMRLLSEDGSDVIQIRPFALQGTEEVVQ